MVVGATMGCLRRGDRGLSPRARLWWVLCTSLGRRRFGKQAHQPNERNSAQKDGHSLPDQR